MASRRPTTRASSSAPDAPGRFPVLLSRLPCDKAQRRRPGDIAVFVDQGYVVIMQDTRGRFASDGDEYDGKVGTMGQSDLGATRYLLAPTRTPHLGRRFPPRRPPTSISADLSHGRGLRAGRADSLRGFS